MRRLLIVGGIIAALIYFAWDKPFGAMASDAYRSISSGFDRLGGDLQKNQDPSVKRY
jgi:hypothetical protein